MKPELRAKLNKLIDHNTSIYKGDKVGTLKKTDIQTAYEESFGEFAKQIVETRQGKMVDRFDRKLPAYDLSLAEAISEFYGIQAPNRNALGMPLSQREQEIFVIRQFLKQNEVYITGDTIISAAQRFGHANLNATALSALLVQHSSFDSLNNTTQIPGDYRFIIPELIMAAIRLDYMGGAQYVNWIANEVNISQREVKMPQIRRGAATPRKIGEAESIPFGTLRFGQKTATVFKIGTGFKITDELVEASTLDMLFEYLGEVGTEMAIATDTEASRVLLNGEQAGGIESCPLIGVTTAAEFKFRDIKRAISRMTRLKRNVTRIITGEEDGIDISLLAEFRGFNGQTKLSNLDSILGVPSTLQNDVFIMPSDQVMFLAPDSAMVKLKYKGMTTESRRNPQNQEDELFVSDYIGFAIKRRDGRLLLDKSVTYGAPDNATFPSYMDIDARIASSFKTINE